MSKFYVITRGAYYSYVAIVHRENCPLIKQMRNAHVWDRDPTLEDKWSHYQKCSRCWLKKSQRDKKDTVDTSKEVKNGNK